MAFSKTIRFITLTVCVMSLAACQRPNHIPTVEELVMARETLEETSPRMLNAQPKAVQEFRMTWGRGCPRQPERVKIETNQDVSDNDVMKHNN